MTLPMIKATYTARAAGAASFAPSSNGNMQIALPVTVTQGEMSGTGITWIATFHETTDKTGMTGSDRIIESLQFMGWKGDDLSELTGIDDATARELLPDEIDIVCEPDTYDGKTTLKVKWVNKVGGGRFAFKEPLAGNDLKQFASQMRGQIRGAQQQGKRSQPAGNGASKPTHPNAPGQGPGRDDDLPFAHCGLEFEPSPIARVLR